MFNFFDFNVNKMHVYKYDSPVYIDKNQHYIINFLNIYLNIEKYTD